MLMNDVDPNPNTKMPLVVQQPQQKTVSNLTCCQFFGKLIRKLTAIEDSKTNKIKKKYAEIRTWDLLHC